MILGNNFMCIISGSIVLLLSIVNNWYDNIPNAFHNSK